MPANEGPTFKGPTLFGSHDGAFKAYQDALSDLALSYGARRDDDLFVPLIKKIKAVDIEKHFKSKEKFEEQARNFIELNNEYHDHPENQQVAARLSKAERDVLKAGEALFKDLGDIEKKVRSIAHLLGSHRKAFESAQTDLRPLTRYAENLQMVEKAAASWREMTEPAALKELVEKTKRHKLNVPGVRS